MNFLVEGRGWGIAIETTHVGAEWLREFIRTKRIAPADEAMAVELYEKLTNALDS